MDVIPTESESNRFGVYSKYISKELIIDLPDGWYRNVVKWHKPVLRPKDELRFPADRFLAGNKDSAAAIATQLDNAPELPLQRTIQFAGMRVSNLKFIEQDTKLIASVGDLKRLGKFRPWNSAVEFFDLANGSKIHRN